MRRRPLLTCFTAALGLAALPVLGQGQGTAPSLRSIVVLDMELVDEQNNPATVKAQELRLSAAHAQLQKELTDYQLYRVVDSAPTAELQRKLHAQQSFLYRCDDCAYQIGLKAGADLVMATWVQKVSELILNFNVEIHDVAQQKVLLSKSVDMRGNEDVSWTRAVHYLVRDMSEKRAKNSKYGL